MKTWAVVLAAAVLGVSCNDHDHGHDHGDHGHDDHGRDHGDGESISCTQWTEDYELFVEIERPTAGKSVGYHAHITALDEFKPALEGKLVVEWWNGDSLAAEASADGVARPGIFTPKSEAPKNGSYKVLFRYTRGGDQATFECGTITVGGDTKSVESATALAFTKEQQWVIPFSTAKSVTRKMAREVELSAVVEPAGTDQLTISAPTSGRFFHNPKLSLAEGLHIEKGQKVGSIAPTVAGDDYSELTGAVAEAKLAKSQALAEVKRLKPLVAEGLLPEKRLTVARNEVERENAKLSAARNRLARVVAPGGKGGLTVKSSLGGVVTEILVANGEQVEPGAPLLRIGGEHSRWLRARFVVRPDHELHDATPIAVRTPSGERMDVRGKARLLSHHPIVDPRSQLATWIAQVSLGDKPDASSHELRSGTSVVLLLSVGTPTPRVAVPRGAVVDINTRPYVFVQVEGESFEKRRVTVGVADNDFIEIISGVEAGERVVTQGGYDIHLVSVMGSMESHKH